MSVFSVFKRNKKPQYLSAVTRVRRSMKEFIYLSVFMFLTIFIMGGAAFVLSMRYIIRANKDGELLRLLENERIKLENTVSCNFALVTKMARSPIVIKHFADPVDDELKEMAVEEIKSYGSALGGMTFWVNDFDRIFYSTNNAPYVIDPAVPENYWYNMTLYKTQVYNFNINYNPDLDITNLWINAPVFDKEKKPLGMLGAGVDISEFIKTLYDKYQGKAELYFFNSQGEITGARDVSIVSAKENIEKKFGDAGTGFLTKALELNANEIYVFNTFFGEIAVGTVPSLGWYSVAIMPDSIDDYKTPMTVLFVFVLIVIALILVIFNIFIAGFLVSQRETMVSLEAASRAKSDFLARMSHEIRTPISAIVGISQIELQKEGLSEEYASALEKIYASGRVLLGIINDILDMSKIETGKLELNPTEYNVTSLINDVVQINIVRISANSKPINFILDVDENLPSNFYGDELRLKEILNNLLSNAIKYTSRGSVRLSVTHTFCGEDALVRFVVEDTGQGMKPEDQKRLFSEYSRFNAELNRSTEGSGLGLNITKKLVEMMDGTIKIESEYGKGSTVTVEVKQKMVECKAIGAEISEKLRNFAFSCEKQISDMRIVHEYMPYGSVLVVDDVSTNLYVAKGLLMPYGLKIDMVNSGFSAIDKVKNGNVYDIIFMDHMMPEMDGIEATRIIRELGYAGTIIALTANALVGNDEMFKKNGFDEFLSKPIDIRMLDAMLNEFICKRKPTEVVEEARRQKPETNLLHSLNDGGRLSKIFVQDAKKIVVKIENLIEKKSNMSDDDLHIFTINVHAMKSALASIGENKASAAALNLEEAGRAKDKKTVLDKTPAFIDLLKAVIEKTEPKKEEADKTVTEDDEDGDFLRSKAQVILAACEEYNQKVAKDALKELKLKNWSAAKTELLDEISQHLLHGDFEEAAKLTQRLDNKS